MDMMVDICGPLQVEINRAHCKHQEGADQHWLPAPAFQPGDKVCLDAQNICTQRPSQKLDHRRLGPFTILEDLPLTTLYAYHLDLPASMRIHLVFHVSLLETVANDPYPGQMQLPPPPIVVNRDEE